VTDSQSVPEQPDTQPPDGQPRFGRWLSSMWLYTVLRFGLFFVLWGILVLLGINGLLGAVIAMVLSIPLSFVLLARPRARFAAVLEQRLEAQRARRAALDTALDPHSHDLPDE
jgi:Protein of unknown function (DUF4229)